jgi:hypothetical protein
MRKIRVVYTDSEDLDWFTEEIEEILLAPDMVLESTEDEPEIFVLDYPVKDDQKFIYIDRATCKRFHAEFLASDNPIMTEIDFEWLTKASFLQVVRVFSEPPSKVGL